VSEKKRFETKLTTPNKKIICDYL